MGAKAENMIHATLGTGVNGTDGEIGQYTLEKNGFFYNCGRTSCLEIVSPIIGMIPQAHES